MSKVKEKNDKNKSIERGFYTTLFLVIIFRLLGYSFLLSFLFALSAGISMMLISLWWLIPEEIKPEKSSEEKVIETPINKYSKRQNNHIPRLVEAQKKRKLQEHKRKKYQPKNINKILGFFSKRKNKRK
jgi:hypothetical protein